MKIRIALPFLCLAGLVLTIGIACDLPIPTTPTGQQTTNPPAPATGGSGSDYFTEEFTSTSLPGWEAFWIQGEEDDTTIASGDDVLSFTLDGTDIYAYYIYSPTTYTDVRLDAQAENRGVNNNNVSLICRYNDEGWYEFNLANNGLFDIFAFLFVDNSYHLIYNGGSTAIKMGKEINDYAAVCEGDTLTLYINGVEAASIEENEYNLSEGNVGLGVSSFNVYPVKVDWKYFTISEP